MSSAPELTWSRPDPKPEREPLFENAPLGFARWQRQGTITPLNSRLEQMLSLKPQLGQPLQASDVLELPEPESRRLINELLDGERDKIEIGSQSADGRKLRWTAWRVVARRGEADYALAIAQDDSENAEAEQRLRQARKLEAVGRLAGSVAHDFNNLLTGVLLYCDLLLASLEPAAAEAVDRDLDQNTLTEDDPDAGEASHAERWPEPLNIRVRKYAEEIRNAGLQASSVVRQLLLVARPTKEQPALISLNEIVEGQRNLLARLIGENITLNFQLDPDLGLVKMDPTQAQQILLNLVLNARDAIPRGGQITVETVRCGIEALREDRNDSVMLPCTLFVVSDNGSGMDAATRAQIFDAFFTTKAAGKGTGLGLATVYEIVTGHGGVIHVDSAPGRGTRVSMLLPVAPATANEFPV